MHVWTCSAALFSAVASIVAAASSDSTSFHSRATQSVSAGSEESAVQTQGWDIQELGGGAPELPRKVPPAVENQRLRGVAAGGDSPEFSESSDLPPRESLVTSNRPEELVEEGRAQELGEESDSLEGSTSTTPDVSDGEEALQGVCVFLVCWLCVGILAYVVLNRRRRKHERERYRRLATIFS